jgi:hypothetical protein
MNIYNLHRSYPEIFEPKRLPEYLQFSDILPFFVKNGEPEPRNAAPKRPVKVIQTNPSAPTLVALGGDSNLGDDQEVRNGSIPMLVFEGKPIALYLPFHFFYQGQLGALDERLQWWGIWISDAMYPFLLPQLAGTNCTDAEKRLLVETYLVNFALFYHKVEIFVARNEVFEREQLYKYHFGILNDDLTALIDRHAHSYAVERIERAESKQLEKIDVEKREAASVIFKKLFQSDVPEDIAGLLNSIYNRMHQPSRHRNKEIWEDIGHWCDAGIGATPGNNCFLVLEIIPGRRPNP